MLVKFHSDAGPSVLMFGDLAGRLLKMMGTSGMVPGALVGQDVGQALARLKDALAIHGHEIANAGCGGGTEAARIDLATRAFPLVELLEVSAREQADFIWEQAH